MGLVDGHERALEPAQQPLKAGEAEPLGGGVHELEHPARHGGHAAPHLTGVEGGRQVGRRDAARLEGGDLVVHQRDQRRDDERRAGEQRRRKLVGEALAAPGGRHQQEASGLQQRFDRLALTGPKPAVAKAREPRFEIQQRQRPSAGRDRRSPGRGRDDCSTRARLDGSGDGEGRVNASEG